MWEKKKEDIRKESHTSKTSRVKKSISDMKYALDETNSGWDTGEENFIKFKDIAKSNYPKWSTEEKKKTDEKWTKHKWSMGKKMSNCLIYISHWNPWRKGVRRKKNVYI